MAACLILVSFQPCIHIPGKQSFHTLVFGKMPDFMNFHNSVPFLHGCTHFRCTPRTADEAFLMGVSTGPSAVEHQFCLLLFHTGTA